MKLLASLLFILLANAADADTQINDFAGMNIILSDISSKQIKQISKLIKDAFSKADFTRGDCFNRALVIGTSLK